MSAPSSQVDDPVLCMVRLGKGECVCCRIAALLTPIDLAGIHECRLPAGSDVELHYHDFDEYRLFTSGHPTITLHTSAGLRHSVTLEPSDLVACVRGIEHTLRVDHDLVYLQFPSLLSRGECHGYFVRTSHGGASARTTKMCLFSQMIEEHQWQFW